MSWKKTKDTGISCKKITNGKELARLCLKNDVISLTYIFQNYIDTCWKTYDDNPLFFPVHRVFTWMAGFRNTGVELDYINDDKFRRILENIMRGGPSSVCGYRCVRQGENKIRYRDILIWHGQSMSKFLPTGYFILLYYPKLTLEQFQILKLIVILVSY